MNALVCCALCGLRDLSGTGICTSCADDGSNSALLFVRPTRDVRSRQETAAQLRAWLGPERDAHAAAAVLRGHQPIARLPLPLATRAAQLFAEHGITMRIVEAARWYRALPPSFIVMTAAVALSGALAGYLALPMLLYTSPAIALLLLWNAGMQLRRPAREAGASLAQLPVRTRATLAQALAQLQPGGVRTLTLEVARVGEATYAALPAPFQKAALGVAVAELVAEAGALALETERIGEVVRELQSAGHDQSVNARELGRSCAARLALLEQTVDVLARIAQHGVQSDGAAVMEAGELLNQVRAEAARRVEAEEAVQALLHASSAQD